MKDAEKKVERVIQETMFENQERLRILNELLQSADISDEVKERGILEVLKNREISISKEKAKMICEIEKKRANFLKFEWLFLGVIFSIFVTVGYVLLDLSNITVLLTSLLSFSIVTTRLFGEYHIKEKNYIDLINKVFNDKQK